MHGQFLGALIFYIDLYQSQGTWTDQINHFLHVHEQFAQSISYFNRYCIANIMKIRRFKIYVVCLKTTALKKKQTPDSSSADQNLSESVTQYWSATRSPQNFPCTGPFLIKEIKMRSFKDIMKSTAFRKKLASDLNSAGQNPSESIKKSHATWTPQKFSCTCLFLLKSCQNAWFWNIKGVWY